MVKESTTEPLLVNGVDGATYDDNWLVVKDDLDLSVLDSETNSHSGKCSLLSVSQPATQNRPSDGKFVKFVSPNRQNLGREVFCFKLVTIEKKHYAHYFIYN
jgi:hypothetical protein